MRSSFFTFILCAFASLTHANPVATSDADEQVRTPGGLRPKSQIHAVPDGGYIRHTKDATLLFDKDGNVVHSAPVVAEAKRSFKEKVLEARKDGWATLAWWTDSTGSPISSFTTTWTVPPAPVTNNGQLLYLFNAIEPADGSAILQPVLQWGVSPAGGGAFWAVAVWYLNPSGTYHSNLVNVSPGQTLVGNIALSGHAGTSFNYTSAFTNIAGFPVFPVQNSTELVWATETLEVYGTTVGTDYPKGSTPMSNINLRTVASANAGVSWTVVNDLADQLTTTVVTNSGVNGRVDIHYPTS